MSKLLWSDNLQCPYFRRNQTSLVHLHVSISTAVFLRDHQLNGTLAEGIVRAPCGSVQYEMDVDGQTWYAAKPSKLETGPLDIIINVLDLPPPGNNEALEIQPSNQQSHRSERSRKSPK
ncbi:unnamed protein product [Hymenolepis diminuta]|uniref:Uncharacterized protein n=1 Tax=Hymenolepis diminuta TaxID=6216 RepID=A0A3P6ZEG3_HYMDI|nr:unnamed protein product [Hymenolepis diminuta]